MTAVTDPIDVDPPKSSKMPLIIGIVLALLGAGGGFYAVQSGLFSAPDATDDSYAAEVVDHSEAPAVAFVPLDPLVVSLPREEGRVFLRFAAQLEVEPSHAAEVEALKPRIVDVLNGYLRAVDLAELEDPTALMRLRGQMLRRVQIVTGEGRIRDLLIMEFVLN